MKVNEKIVFKYNNTTLVYKVWNTSNKYILVYIDGDISNGKNGEVFDLLKIKDRFEFCKKEIGYSVEDKTASFPKINSLKDLANVVDALYERIIELSTPRFQIGDTVMIAKREGNSSDYPYVYTSEMASLENQLFTIKEVYQMSIDNIGSEMQRLKYEEPFYYILKGTPCYWSSAMLHKIGTTKDLITDINAPNITDLIDIGKINICEAPSYIDTHITNGPSLYPEKEEPEYKLTFKFNHLKF